MRVFQQEQGGVLADRREEVDDAGVSRSSGSVSKENGTREVDILVASSVGLLLATLAVWHVVL